MLVGADDGHEHQQHWQDNAVHELRGKHDAHQIEARDKDNHRRNEDDEGEDALEQRRFLPGERNARFPAECLADNECRGKGQHACRQQACRHQADGEQGLRVLAGEGLQRRRGCFGAFHFDALREQHRAGGYDDEPCHDATHHGTGNGIDALVGQVAHAHALFNHVALREEHHPRRDGGTHHSNGKRKKA